MKLTIVNRSTLVTDDDLRKATHAVDLQLGHSFCPAWGLVAPVVEFAPTGTTDLDPAAYIVSVADRGTRPGLLGYHDEISAAVVDAFVFAEVTLAHGGTVLRQPGPGATTVASVLSHEVMEMLVDPCINAWWDGPLTVNGTLYQSVAAEVGDPVQPSGGREDYYVVTLDDEEVWLANFILPAWHDLHAVAPYDFLGHLTRPFSMQPGGYLIVRNAPGGEKSLFAEGALASTRARGASDYQRRRRVQQPDYLASRLASRLVARP